MQVVQLGYQGHVFIINLLVINLVWAEEFGPSGLDYNSLRIRPFTHLV